MKRILITGESSFVGNAFNAWASKFPGNYGINTISFKTTDVNDIDFSAFDVVLHVAGIAHVDSNPSDEEKTLYYSINTDLTVDTAKRAKAAKVKQFVFISSIIVFGDETPLINKDTMPKPSGFYGDSKLKADEEILKLQNEEFNVVSIRPPMIYGKGSKGNYPRLSKLAKITPFFPDYKNQRSMIHIDNLCEFIRLIIDNEEKGVFYPQNKEHVCTTDLVLEIANVHNRKIFTTKLFNPIIDRLINKSFAFKKVFGSLAYDMQMSDYKNFEYNIRSFEESVLLTEGNYNEKKALMLASVSSMIDQFNMSNIKILQGLGYKVDVACNFEIGNTTSQDRVNEFKRELSVKKIGMYQVNIPRSVSKISSIIKSYRETKSLISKNNYKIVHCHSPIGGIIARLACKSARKKGTKVIYTAHGFHFFEGASVINWLLFYNIEKYCAKFTDFLITINQEDYKNAKKFKAENTVYIPGIGVDIKSIGKLEVNRKEMRKSFDISDDRFVCFAIGELSKRKNHETLIRALAEIKDDNIVLFICGKGDLEIYLKELAESLGVSHRVNFLGYRTDVKELLYMADCFVFPSLQEGLPVSLMEAMAVHLPCVASKIRGNTDLLGEDSEYLFEPNYYLGFAKKIMELKENKKKAIIAGESNFKRVQYFDKTNVDKLMYKIYSKII